jgi:hypothetical protein
MIVPIGSSALAVPPVTAITTRRPARDQVQAVVVSPPRESRVAVRVEVVSQDERGDWQQPAAARASERDSEPQPYAYEAALFAANLEASRTAQKLGSADSRRAAAAYSAQSEWRQYGAMNQSEAPQLLDVRA